MEQSRLATVAFGLLWVALISQTAWTIFYASWTIGALTRPLIFTCGFLLVALTRGRTRWIGLLGRLIVAGAFLTALMNRPGNWDGFVRYTARVNSFLPHEAIPAVAVLATIIECVLCTSMLFGINTRWAARGSAVLLFLFATAMTISGLSQAEWAVYVLSAGALALSTTDASLLSVDSVIASVRASITNQAGEADKIALRP